MKKALAMKWVEALRSGKYQQGRQYLNKDGKFCCLGVLCEIEGLRAEVSPLGGPVYYYIGTGMSTATGYPGKSFNKGLAAPAAGYIASLRVRLAALNDRGVDDTDPLNFDEIADIIQICYKEL